MSVHLYVAKDTETLFQKLYTNLCASKKGVFDPEIIVTQTAGTNEWLQQQIASHRGIASNISFLKPNDLINLIYQKIDGTYDVTLKERHLSWAIYSLLGSQMFIQQFPEIAEYYHQDLPNKDQKRLSLAQQVADLFDQYQVYRPKMIDQWNQTPQNAIHENWQAWLWINIPNEVGTNIPDKTQVGKLIIDQLKDKSANLELQQFLPEVHLFGLAVLSDFHAQLFRTIGEHIDVHFYMKNPAPDVYWFEDRNERELAKWRSRNFATDSFVVGHSLLTSWGKTVSDTFRLLLRYDDFANNYIILDTPINHSESLLNQIQQSIFNGNKERDEPLKILDGDQSITLVSCPSKLREVEVLYDHIVTLMNDYGAELSTKNILIQAQNIQEYAPFITSVFGNASLKIPFHIAEENLLGGDTFADAFLSIAALEEQTLTPEKLLEILDHQIVQDYFHLHQKDLYRRVLQEANIRFGISGNIEDETWLVSWENGLRKIIYGLCISEEPIIYNSKPFIPIDIIEGNATWETIDFIHFIKTIITDLKHRKGKKTLATWLKESEQLLVQLSNNAEHEELHKIIEILRSTIDATKWFKEEISYSVYYQYLEQEFQSYQKVSKFRTGGILFTNLVALRGIPFDFIGMLGMNFGDFPRQHNDHSFTLMKDKLLGDRNTKDNDKHLFLESFLSAKKYWYASFKGYSIKDNSAIAPSTLVDELLDYIEQNSHEHDDVRQTLVKVAPLNSYSKLYQKSGYPMNNYSNFFELSSVDWVQEKNLQIQLNDEFDKATFLKFFHTPIQFYFNHVLQIHLKNLDEPLPEFENFEIDPTTNFLLNRILQERLAVDDDFLLRLKLNGHLPLSHYGEALIDDEKEKLQSISSLISNFLGNEKTMQASHYVLQLNDLSINCAWQHVFQGNILVFHQSKSWKKVVKYYVDFLIASTTESFHSYNILNITNGEYRSVELIDSAVAFKKLNGLASYFLQGMNLPIPFIELVASDIKNTNLSIDELKHSINVYFRDQNFQNDYERLAYDKDWFDDQGCQHFLEFYQDIYLPAQELFINA